MGGAPADPGKWSFVVALEQANDGESGFFCGGQVVSSHIILTAAHCVYDRQAADFDVISGQVWLNAGDGQILHPQAVVVAPNYGTHGEADDFALVRVREEIAVAPIPLAKRTPHLGAKVRVAGWGVTDETGLAGPSPRLLSVGVNILPARQCLRAYRSSDYDVPTMLCAGLRRGGKDACAGDSGGPLVSWAGGRPQLVGTVSWGEGCARAKFPGVYGRIATARPWLDRTITALGSETEAFVTRTWCDWRDNCFLGAFVPASLANEARVVAHVTLLGCSDPACAVDLVLPNRNGDEAMVQLPSQFDSNFDIQLRLWQGDQYRPLGEKRHIVAPPA